MRRLVRSDFFLRFAGGFALGAVAVASFHTHAVASHLTAWIGAVAHVA